MNHFGEIRNLVSFVRPHVALITTIAPAHLEFFGNCESIADAKSEIFEGVLRRRRGFDPRRQPLCRAPEGASSAGPGLRYRWFRQLRVKPSFCPSRPMAAACASRPIYWVMLVDCLVGAPGAHIAQNAVGALAAVALLDGDVLNAAAALKNFTALKGRGARFEADGVTVIDESYNANPASMAAALALLGNAQGRKIAVLGDMLEMGDGGIIHHAGLAQPILANNVDLVFASGAQMKALWEVLPPERRGSYAETSADVGAQAKGCTQARRHRSGEGLKRRKNVGDHRSSQGKAGLMLYYLSLLTHTDQLAFFRLFKYLTFRSGAAVDDGANDCLPDQSDADPLAENQTGQGPAHPLRRATTPYHRKGGHAHHGRLC